MSASVNRHEVCEQNAVAPDSIYICPGDPYSAPRGGQTAFAVQALNAFNSRFALVAPDETGDKPIGAWFVDDWNKRPIWRFNIGSYAPDNKSSRPFIPRRIVFRWLIKKYLPEIRRIPTRNLFCDSPELLGVLKEYGWDSFCYRFAGLNNPVGVSRYKFLRVFSGVFHARMTRNLALMHPDALLASADKKTILEYERENSRVLGAYPLHFFPTRFDDSVFSPGVKDEQRQLLNLNEYDPVLVSVGRLCWIKGWKLALNALAKLKKKYPKILFLFVGDGEDRRELERYAQEIGIGSNIRIQGFLPPYEVRNCLVASDLYVCSSYREGWSVALTEALGCGKICVSTEVSGAKDMIEDGVNGKIVRDRTSDEFAAAIDSALALERLSLKGKRRSLELARRYSSATLANDWGNIWKPLRPKENA